MPTWSSSACCCWSYGYLVARQPDVVGLRDRATVAVLPFENLSAVADGEMLALGIAESVLHQLANLQQLDVISRTSSFNFRGRVGGCARDRPVAEGELPARGQRAARSHATAHHYATDRREDRRGRVVHALRSSAQRYLRGAGRDRAAGDARARADARCGCDGAHEGAGHRKTWMPTWRTCRPVRCWPKTAWSTCSRRSSNCSARWSSTRSLPPLTSGWRRPACSLPNTT